MSASLKISASECPSVDIVTIGAMQMVQKTLADVFCQDVEELMGSGCVVVIAFDTYYDIFRKNSWWSGRLGNAVPVEFNLDHAFDISDASLLEILSHTRTEQQLTSFFEKRLQTYLEQKDIEFVIAGNGSTVMPWGEQSSNSHEETDSLIAHIIKLAVEQVLCTVIPLYTIISNLFFKIIKKMVQFHSSNLFS